MAKILLESNLENLAAELLTGSLSEKDTGSMVKLEFFLEGALAPDDYKQIEVILLDVWGETRKIQQMVHYYPLENHRDILNIFTVEFERLVREEQLDDLAGMVQFMITTVQQLSKFTSKPAL